MDRTEIANGVAVGLEYFRHKVKMDIAWGIFIVFAGAVAVYFVGNEARLGFDDSDHPTNNVRSGLGLRIDHGTGCEYLVAPNGGITPRLGASGKHICRNDGTVDEE